MQAHDAREVDGTHFLVMEYVEGVDLHELVKRCGPLRMADACELVRQAAVGLQYAHEHGLVHRDIKPSNLMLSFGECRPPHCSPVSPKPDLAGQDATPTAQIPDATPRHLAGFGETRLHSEPTVKILDLGLALLTVNQPGAAEMTGTGQAMGTADYIAPEQVTDSHHVDIRADIYSLGCTLYKLLTGHAPFAGPEYAGGYQKMTAHIHEPIKPLGARRQDLPEDLERVLQRMVAKQPADRFSTPDELAQALKPFAAGAHLRRLAAQARGEALPSGADETVTWSPSVRRSLRDRLWSARSVAIALLFFAFLACGIIFTLRDGQQTVKVEIDPDLVKDAAVTFSLDGREMEIKGVGETIKLKPGEHGYEIRRGDQIIKTREFTIVKGDNPVLKISVEGTPVAAETPGATKAVAGTGYELLFDGDSSYVETPVKYDGSHPLTLEAYVTIADMRDYSSLISNFHEAKGISLEIDPRRRWGLAMRLSENGEYAHAVSEHAAPIGRHHVAVVFANSQPSLFVDGLGLEIGRFSDKDKYQPPTEPFTIGAQKISNYECSYVFSGAIDEVRISRRARYRTDFIPEKRLEPDGDTLALYHFDEGVGDVAHDASGNGNDAKIVGAQWVEVGHKRPLAGLIAQPTQIPGLGRWQVATVRPTEEVNSVAWSPDGTLIACGTKAGWVRIYDARTLALVRLLAAHNDVTCVAWSPDGQWLAASCMDGTARLWKADGSPGPVLAAHDPVMCVAWNPASERLASGHYNGRVQLWSVDGTRGPTLEGHTEQVRCVAWRPDGKRLASGGDRTVRLWSTDGTAVRVLEGDTARVTSVAWSPDGERLVSGSSDGSIRLCQEDGSSSTLLKGQKDLVVSLAWSPNGTHIISGSSDGKVCSWHSIGASDPIIAQAGYGYGYVNSMSWSPDGRQVVSAGQDGTIRLWKNDGTASRALDAENQCITSIAWSPDSQQIAFTGSKGRAGGPWVWQADGTPRAVFRGHTSAVESVAWSPDGQRLASGGWDGTIRLWRSDGTSTAALTGHKGSVRAVAWSPDGQRLASASGDHTVRLWQADGTPGPVLEGHEDVVFCVAWHPDGIQLASGGGRKMIRFWGVDGSPGTVMDTGNWVVFSLAWNPSGEYLAAGTSGNVGLWQRDGKPGPKLRGAVRAGFATAWSPDGSLFASGSDDTTIRLWQADGTSGRVLRGHLGTVNAVTWAPDGKRLASGDVGGMIRVWNVETGTVERSAIRLRGGKSVVFSAAGDILYGHPKVIEEELIYLVEPPDGPIELLKPSEFKKRAGR